MEQPVAYMVRILWMFVRAQRDRVWDLHLVAFQKMLPFFYRHDHGNYAKWGTIYLAETKQLPDEIEKEFKMETFVLNVEKAKFNQVDPDQGQEWLNGTGKK